MLYKKILECKLEFPYEISAICKDMIKKLLCINPDKRIKIDQIKQHSFYTMGLKQLKKKEFIIDHKSISNKVLEKLGKLGYKSSEIKNSLKNNENNYISTAYNLLYNKLKTAASKNSLSNYKDSNSFIILDVIDKNEDFTRCKDESCDTDNDIENYDVNNINDEYIYLKEVTIMTKVML